MEPITVNTGLDGFRLLDRISEVDDRCIRGETSQVQDRAALMMEAMAQLGAMHVRYLIDFQCHAFLLTVRDLKIPGKELKSPCFRLSAVLENRSSRGFSYRVFAKGEGGRWVSGIFLYATTPFDDSFQKEKIQPQYEKVFLCLRNV